MKPKITYGDPSKAKPSPIRHMVWLIPAAAFAGLVWLNHEAKETPVSKADQQRLEQLTVILAVDPEPVKLVPMKHTTMLAELYPDYANDKNPKSLPDDWNYAKGKRK